MRVDHTYLICPHILVHKLLLRYKKAKDIKLTPKTPFFFDSKGEAFLRQHGQSLDWSDFAAISSMTKVNSMTFRHNMSHILKLQTNMRIAEMEEYVACHSKATQASHYADDDALQAPNLQAQDWYANEVVLAEYEKLQL